jgi:hypothetical protein
MVFDDHHLSVAVSLREAANAEVHNTAGEFAFQLKTNSDVTVGTATTAFKGGIPCNQANN